MVAAASRRGLACQSCGAALLVDAAQRTITCPFCESHAVIERPGEPQVAPTFALGFTLRREDAAKRVRSWIGSRGFFTRSDFKRAALDKTQGVYAPAYLYGAVAETRYAARIGERYQKTVYRDGEVKRETRTEWRTLEGRHTCYVQDIVVTASKGIDNEALEQIEPFPLGELHRYSPSLISGWTSEEPTHGPETCFQLAHEEAVRQVGRRLSAFMPGDEHKDLRYESRLFEETLDLVLLPIWSFAARYHEEKPPVQILVNGRTGEVFGKVPRSWIKIGLVALSAAAAVAGAAYALSLLGAGP